MSETLYTLVNYSGPRNLNEEHWTLLRDQLMTKRFVGTMNAVGRMAGNMLKGTDLKLNPNGVKREWLWGIIVEIERELTDNQWQRLSRLADREGLTINREQHGKIGKGLKIILDAKADDYGITRQSEDTLFDLIEPVIEHEMRLAAEDVLEDAGLPLSEATNFTVSQSLLVGRGVLSDQSIADRWNTYVSGAGSALWETEN